MTAAYELTRANYNCKIIELTDRAEDEIIRRGAAP